MSNGASGEAENHRRTGNGPVAETDPGLAPSERPTGEGPDVYLNVPQLNVEEISLNVENLEAHVSLNAAVLDLLKLNVGADAFLGRVDLEIKGVEAQALLEVRLNNVAAIVNRVLTTLDRNPEILRHVGRGVESAARGIGGGAGKAVGELGTGAKGAVEDVGEGAERAAESVGEGAGDAAKDVGKGAGQAAESAGEGVRDVGEGAGETAASVGRTAGEATGQTAEGADTPDGTTSAGGGQGEEERPEPENGGGEPENGRKAPDTGPASDADTDRSRPGTGTGDDATEQLTALGDALRETQASVRGLGRALVRLAPGRLRPDPPEDRRG